MKIHPYENNQFRIFRLIAFIQSSAVFAWKLVIILLLMLHNMLCNTFFSKQNFLINSILRRYIANVEGSCNTCSLYRQYRISTTITADT